MLTGSIRGMDEKALKRLAREVHAARLARGMSKEAVARQVGVSSITYKRVEDGEPVREDSLAKVLGGFGIPMPDATGSPGVRNEAWLRDVIGVAEIDETTRQSLLAVLDQRRAAG